MPILCAPRQPQEADFFYLPVYTACYQFPVWGACVLLLLLGMVAAERHASGAVRRKACTCDRPPALHLHADANDAPWWPPGGPIVLRSSSASLMLVDVHNYIRTRFPYWNRHGGADHIVLAPHDEGTCWVPAVLRPAIILGHWGRTELDHISQTNWIPDNYTIEMK